MINDRNSIFFIKSQNNSQLPLYANISPFSKVENYLKPIAAELQIRISNQGKENSKKFLGFFWGGGE